MKKKEETKVFNPILLIAAILMAAIALFAGYWLVRDKNPTPPTSVAVSPPAKEKESPVREKEVPQKDSESSKPRKSQESETPPAKPVTSISGSVVQGNTPIRVFDAKVQAYREGYEPLETVANSNGEFSFEGIEPGQWQVRASKDGFASVSADSNGAYVSPTPVSPAKDIVLRLVSPVPLEGKVLNVLGKEVPTAIVQVFDGRNADGAKVSGPVLNTKTDKGDLDLLSVRKPLAEVTTDETGVFRFSDLETGTYSLVAFAEGYSRKVVLGAQTETTDTVFRLEPEVRVSGQVRLAPAGSPIVGASIAVTIVMRDAPAISGSILTNSTGSFSIGGLPRRFTLSLRAFYKEAESALYENSFSGGVSQHKQDLLVFERRRIIGRVVDSFERKPVVGVGVLLENRARKLSEVAQTDAQGLFEVTTGITSNNLLIGKREGTEDLTFPVEFTGDEESIHLGDIEIVQGVKISGRVINDRKSGVGGALVRALPVEGNLVNPADIRKVPCNSSGDFLFPLIPPGKYYLSAEAAGYKAGYYGDPKPATEGAHPVLVVRGGQPLQGIQIPVTSAATFTVKGEVVDATGTPVLGAQIQLQLAEGDPGRDSLRTASQEAGKFELKEVPSGRYRLTAQKEGYWPTFMDRIQPESKLVASSNGVRIVLEKKAAMTISGKVTDSMGGPLLHAEVAAFAGRMESLVAGGLLTGDLLPSWRGLAALGSDTLERGAVVETTTKVDGTYVIENLRPGSYTVIALDEKTGNSDMLFDVDAGATGVDFQLEASSTLHGTVLNADGRTPCREFILEAFSESGVSPLAGKASGGSITSRVQSEDGSFELSGLAAGQYILNVQAEGQGEVSTAFEIIQGEEPPDLKLVMNSGGSIVGKVVGKDGQPATDATVGLGDIRRAVLPDGSFTFLGLPPDRYAVVVTHPGYAPAIAPNIAVQDGVPANVGVIQLGQGGAIQGFVRFSNGAGAADYVVQAEPSGGMTNPTHVDLFVTRTDESGYYTLSDVALGQYRLLLRSPSSRGNLAHSGYGQILQSRFVSVNEGAPANVDMTVDAGSRMSGIVTVGGEPLGGSTLVLYPRFRTDVTEFVTVTDRLGNYTFEGIPPGSYEAVAGEYSIDRSHSVTLTVPEVADFEQNFTF